MMEMASVKKRKPQDKSLIDLVFSWSLEDVFNEELYKYKVENIPESFQSVQHYLESYVVPLIEETRAELASSMDIISMAPFAEVISLEESKPYGSFFYDVEVDSWRNRSGAGHKELYKPLPGDIFVLADVIPEIVSDLQRAGRTWAFASLTKIPQDEHSPSDSKVAEDDDMPTYFRIKASKAIEVGKGMQNSLYAFFLINITTNKRIWSALHTLGNLKIIKEILYTDSVVEEICDLCSAVQSDGIWAVQFGARLSSMLNESQTGAVLDSISIMQCKHKSSVKLIWGPPGTGKTKTVSTLLWTLLRMNCRTLICAPTNVAITEVASRVKQVKESFLIDPGKDISFCPLGDMVLFGNKDRLKVTADLEELYLDYRVDRLVECFGPLTGWKPCFTSMIDFLEECVPHYHIFLENESSKEKEISVKDENSKEGGISFLEFIRIRYKAIALQLIRCVRILCTHISIGFILEHNFRSMVSLIDLLESFGNLLSRDGIVCGELEELFSHPEVVENPCPSFVDTIGFEAFKCSTSTLLFKRRSECLFSIRSLRKSLDGLNLPNFMSKISVREFCFQTASLIFCTASSSFKLHSVVMEPLDLLVIDEASQLKECESLIPLQLSNIRHAILIGDECQLPAMVHSKVSDEAGFGRSLFERLSLLGHSKHLLNMQYRMHPSISSFPNSKFYLNQILDAPRVKSKSYERRYLPGPMFGPYSFINISDGKEVLDDVGHSRKNLVEVAVVMRIVRNLFRAWNGSSQKLSIGIISPYSAQVAAIQEKLGQKYEKLGDFVVKVKSIDGFQGGEEDIVIISTVRSNHGGSIGFLSIPQRTNVALTRARHSLWILGNGTTLIKSDSVWEAVVCDAKDRQCFFNADEDKDLAKAILQVKKELEQFDDLLNGESILFKSARWKVLFSDNFRKSFGKLKSNQTRKSVINLLLKLSSGWRPKKRNVGIVCESEQLVKQFKVEGLYLVCTIDVVKDSTLIQVLKVWDILPLEDIPKLVKRLDSISAMYTNDYVNRCNAKCLEGDLEVPYSWGSSADIVRYKNLNLTEAGDGSNAIAFDGRSYVENSKVSESLLLMKFYSLSSGVVGHLLSGRDGRELDLPFEVTDRESEIILFPRSTFILGRSGTGKTTVLTMKLIQKEQQHYLSSEGLCDMKSNISKEVSWKKEVNENLGETKGTFLRQIFVTVSPKLCSAVKHHISHLKSFSCGGNISAENRSIAMHDIDDTTEFGDIPDRFIDIPPKSYPLVITFQKFLMMLDGSIGNSYFDKFHEVRELSHGKTGILRSSALQALIRMKEINYDLFNSFYWPHFNSQLTKKLDPSAVFTEIISHIKGGLRAGEARDGKLSREDYVSLSEGRVSNLSQERRCMIYDIFLDYEKKKLVNGEFDLADLVVDLHRRLRDGSYEGEEMDFVYIDEVQDLTMRQIALFKYICRNFDEGFVFSGDTAQTIARGIDFRFQDIRYLFYKEFLLEIKSDGNDRAKDKGQQRISNIFHLNQNFRTHAGVLKLAQSVIELLYRFFPLSIDVLSPETSLIYGEAPVLLESGNDENAIITIFGNSGNIGGSMVVGFGAEQVILVRDEFAKMEISDHVGKQALVLTIVECKGLEFQDVLLYNFFGTSPLKNQWRVVYDYMKEQNLLDNTAPRSFPSFDKAKHNILCSELKQLYVAITRTRQRLWICENIEEFSRPIFDYWKKLCLVQVRKLDDSLAQAMQVASSKEEWSLRGIKLFNEGNFEMATMCFERAGDTYREKWAKAAGLRAAADRMRGSNSEMSRIVLMEAAEIYETIGRAESAATCFIELKEFQRAGMIYLEKCGDSKLEDAGDCFSLAGCWSLAADVYARGNYFSKCLSVCTNGKFFDMGLQFIQYWKQNATPAVGMAERSQELNEIEQAFLEKCALHYHELKDKRTMMKCVKAFNSMDSIRTFLRTGDYLDELMSLEEESGNYMEAATIARLKGDLRSMMKFVKAFNSMDSIRTFLRTGGYLDELMLLEDESGNFMEAATIANLKGDLIFEADMLGKAGHFKDASRLILLFVLSNSLWASGSKGWPLKKFLQKEELLTKAKMITENKSQDDVLYKSVCMEASVLTNQESSLYQMEQHLSASQRIKNLRVEIFSARKILDVHLQSEPSKYEWEQELVSDLMMHATDTITRNRCSVETLIYFWSFWKENIMNIFKYLRSLETKHGNEYKSYGEFCLDYLGVQWRENNPNTNYQLLNSDAHWLKGIDNRSLQRNGNIVSMDVPHFASAAQSYWSSEVLFVGMKVLEKLEALLKLSIRNSFSLFCQSMAVLHIFEVTKVLMESEFLDQNYHSRALQKFLASSTKHFFDYVFPLDWRKTMAENMIALRGTDLSNNLLKEILIENINRTDKLTYGQIARVVMLVFVSGKLTEELYEMIAKRFNENRPWKGFIDKLKEITGSRFGEVSLVFNLQIALEDTYRDNWRKEVDYVSPHCYVYLVERFLFLVSTCQGHFYTTKSSLVEMIICQDWNANSSICSVYSEGFHDFIARFIDQFFFNRGETSDWLMKFGLTSRDCYPLLVLRLVIMLSLVCVNSGKHFRLLSNLLGRSDISSQLPWAFCNTLRGRRNHNFVNVLAEALGTVENSLVMVNLGNDCSQILCPDAIIINMKFIQRREDVLRMLFPKNVKDTQGQVGSVKLETTSCSGSLSPDSNDIGKSALRPSCSNLAGMVDQSLKIGNQNEDGDLQKSYGHFWETFDALKSGEDGKYENATNFTSNAPQIKLKVEIFIRVIEAALTRLNQKNLCDNEGGILFADANSMLDELKQLSIALDASDQELENNISTLGELFQKLRERRPRLQPFLDCMFLQNVEVPKASVASGTQSNSNKEDENKDVESSVSKKGKKVATSASNSKKGKETNKAKENSKSKKGKKGKGGRKK